MPSIPPAMNLGQPMVAIPSILFREPKEGPKSVAFTIDWSRPLARTLDTVSINMQDGSPLEFSQICGLIIDNSNCGSDLDFIFPDTDVSVSIPAYAPYTALQVNTHQVQFFVRALAALSGDVTAFWVLNYPPAPVAVPITKQQLRTGVNNLTLDGVTTSQLIAATINGTIQAFTVNVAGPTPSVSFNDLLQLKDGAGNILWAGNVAQQITSTGFIVNLAGVNSISLRFRQGLQLVQTGGFAPGATVNASVYYITP